MSNSETQITPDNLGGFEFLSPWDWDKFLKNRQVPTTPSALIKAITKEYSRFAVVCSETLAIHLGTVMAGQMDRIIAKNIELFPAHLQLEAYAALYGATVFSFTGGTDWTEKQEREILERWKTLSNHTLSPKRKRG